MTSATAPGCGPATSIGTVTASSPSSTAVSAPTVINYPRQPPRDDGRLAALAAIIGGLLDATMGGDGISEAQNAEGVWMRLLDVMRARGEQELQRVDSERAKLPEFEDDLRAAYQRHRLHAEQIWTRFGPLDLEIVAQSNEAEARSDQQWDLLSPLDNRVMGQVDTHSAVSDEEYQRSKDLCTDQAFDELCEFVSCGYTPDYRGIEARARADAEVAARVLVDDACRRSSRYNTRQGTHEAAMLQLGILSAALANTAKAREAERLEAFKLNLSMRTDHAQLLETTRMKRLDHAASERRAASTMLTERWTSHAETSITLDRAVAESLRERWNSWVKLYEFSETTGNQLSEAQWRMFAESAFRSLREGGEMLASAAQAYQFLAASIRATAKQGGAGSGGITSVLTALATIIPIFSGSCGGITIPLVGTVFPNKQDCCAAPAPPAA